MMRYPTAALLPVLALLAAALMPAGAAHSQDYETLVAQAKRDDPQVDFGKLREAYVKSPGYDPYSVGVAEPTRAMRKAVAEKDCKTALTQAKRIMEVNFVFIDAHLAAAHCYDIIGQPADAQRERRIGQGLVASILKSGDGKTPETAFTVVTVSEEYFTLMALGLRRGSQSLMSHGGHSYDRLDATPVSSTDPAAKVSVYFRIDSILARARQQLLGEAPGAQADPTTAPRP